MRYLGHRTFSLPLLLTAVLAACGPSGGPQGGAPGGFPPAPVSVMTVAPADVPVEFEYVGQTAGSREVEIRARVSGIWARGPARRCAFGPEQGASS